MKNQQQEKRRGDYPITPIPFKLLHDPAIFFLQ
jgi:hypothetical protein